MYPLHQLFQQVLLLWFWKVYWDIYFVFKIFDIWSIEYRTTSHCSEVILNCAVGWWSGRCLPDPFKKSSCAITGCHAPWKHLSEHNGQGRFSNCSTRTPALSCGQGILIVKKKMGQKVGWTAASNPIAVLTCCIILTLNWLKRILSTVISSAHYFVIVTQEIFIY